jgi:peptide/nickel transport system substrate-binding protein
MAWTLLACTKPEADSATRKDSGGNVLRFDVWGPIGSLDSSVSEGGSVQMISPFLYSYLFTENDKWQLEPDLAIQWSYDPKTFTWTIKLREGALFHNGKPVTSCDVKYSMETFLAKFSPSASILIDRVNLLNDHLISIVLNRDDPEFLKKIWSIEIIPQSAGNDMDWANHPIGSGPFKLDYRKGADEIGLVANENYYRGRPSLDRVVFSACIQCNPWEIRKKKGMGG